MFFRNLSMFRFPAATALDALDAQLQRHRLKPVAGHEPLSRGFVAPLGEAAVEDDAATETALTHRIDRSLWLTLGMEERLLPPAVIDDQLGRRLAALERREGRPPGSRTRRRLKDDLVAELLPRAFVRPRRIDALIDLQHHVVAVDTASRVQAEALIGELRHALGSFPALPLNPQRAPRTVLTGWMAGERLPDGLMLGEECELRDPTDFGAVVKCLRHDLQADEIVRHLRSGKQVARLGLVLDAKLTFVLGEDLVVRKLKFLDGAVDALEGTDRGDVRAELDARSALMGAEFSRLFGVLENAFLLGRAD
ncbi:MAG TPA: recombination-associated protein RdgC [Xanthomonadaceae bacterium]|nr:recombination-associated protein RdgC [Xanthomonadaceae bacterium]